jgi:hypothetical protein
MTVNAAVLSNTKEKPFPVSSNPFLEESAMFFNTWSAAIKRKMQTVGRDRLCSAGPKHRCRPVLEILENRVTPTNLIVNGGFEMGTFFGWTQGGDLSFTNVNGVRPHSGSFAAQVGPTTSDGFLTQTLTTTPGFTYVFDYWLDHGGGGTPNDFAATVNGVDIPGSVFVNDVTNFAYTEFSFTFTGTGLDTVGFRFMEVPAYWYIDDVSVEGFTESTSLPALFPPNHVFEPLLQNWESPPIVPVDGYNYGYRALRITDTDPLGNPRQWDPGQEAIYLLHEIPTSPDISDVLYVINQTWSDLPNPVASIYLFSDGVDTSGQEVPIDPTNLPIQRPDLTPIDVPQQQIAASAIITTQDFGPIAVTAHVFSDPPPDQQRDPSDTLDVTAQQAPTPPPGGSGSHVAFDGAALASAVSGHVWAAALAQGTTGQATPAALPAEPAAWLDHVYAELGAKDATGSLPVHTLVTLPAIEPLGVLRPGDDLWRL